MEVSKSGSQGTMLIIKLTGGVWSHLKGSTRQDGHVKESETGVKPGKAEAGAGKTIHSLRARMSTWKSLELGD